MFWEKSKMTGNFFKVLAVIVLSCIFGLFAGFVTGRIVGIIANIFVQETIEPSQAILISMVMAILVGGGLGYIATQANRRTFEIPDHPIPGIMLGLVIGFIVLLIHGVIDIPDSGIIDARSLRIPKIYGATIGSYIGAIIFPLIGIRGVIHEAKETRRRIKANEESENELSYYKNRKSEGNK
jgi:LytS/YehU family sensor histidine kinase